METNAAQLPKYKCHKEVFALKIHEVMQPKAPGDGCVIFPADTNFSPIPIAAEFFARHQPKAGGYLVIYNDGYTSFSPAEAFEAGYTLIRPPYQQRVIEEQEALHDKVVKLSAFIDSDRFGSVSPAEQIRMTRQHSAMSEYDQILIERIHAF